MVSELWDWSRKSRGLIAFPWSVVLLNQLCEHYFWACWKWESQLTLYPLNQKLQPSRLSTHVPILERHIELWDLSTRWHHFVTFCQILQVESTFILDRVELFELSLSSTSEGQGIEYFVKFLFNFGSLFTFVCTGKAPLSVIWQECLLNHQHLNLLGTLWNMASLRACYQMLQRPCRDRMHNTGWVVLGK